MADMDECAQRACFRMAEVTVMHSVMTSATGSTAIVIGVCRVSVGGMLCTSAASAASVPSSVMVDGLLEFPAVSYAAVCVGPISLKDSKIHTSR
jgi:hypothetical protein